ncbi:uncharacterized protein LOC125008963 [Mugil cephalus]|uniref:uncharacterized protein LOC125008963 n=1 Tax=Mugil cephalus TaxID=48193 RepID=UPI001FB60CE3|nr:uncharacterized protein LOC125008963 [Mugil cephalus]
MVVGKAKECEVKVADLVEQGKQAGLLQKSKIKTKTEAQDKERRDWTELAVWWQSTTHLHSADKEKDKGGPKELVTTQDTHTRPSPYAPPKTPTPGIYPTLCVTEGTLQIDDIATGEIASPAPVPASTTKTPPPMTLTSPDKTPLRPQSVTSSDTEIEYSPNNPFQDRQQREHGGIDYRAYREAEEEVKREGDRTIQRLKEFEDQVKRELMQDQEQKSNRNRPTPRDNTDLMWDLSEGEECEPPVTGAAAFTGKGRYEGQTRDVGVKWKLKGRWENRPQADEEEEQIAELEKEVEKATERLRASMEKTQNWVADAKRRRRSVRDRGKRDESRDRQDHHHLAIPLLSTAGQPDKYKPFTLGDIQTIVDKLPPVVEGGNRWLDKLDSLTAGQKLALGDFRAVAARCMTGGDLRDIETDANTKGLPDNAPFTRQSTAIGQAMRDKYPLPHAATMPKLRWNPEQSPREFLTQAKDQWVSNTGCHPGHKSAQREWFRQAVLEGVPESVRNMMKNNPDMQGCDAHVWEKHLVHHLTAAQDKALNEGKELTDLQAQLLKLQLADARNKVNDKKKEKTVPKVMVSTEPQPNTPDLFPVPPWAPQPPLYPSGPPGGYLRGNYQRRGRATRGWGARGDYGRGYGGPRPCFLCGDTMHWARDCPHYAQHHRGG